MLLVYCVLNCYISIYNSCLPPQPVNNADAIADTIAFRRPHLTANVRLLWHAISSDRTLKAIRIRGLPRWSPGQPRYSGIQNAGYNPFQLRSSGSDRIRANTVPLSVGLKTSCLMNGERMTTVSDAPWRFIRLMDRRCVRWAMEHACLNGDSVNAVRCVPSEYFGSLHPTVILLEAMEVHFPHRADHPTSQRIVCMYAVNDI